MAPEGLLRRLITIQRHFLATLLGSAGAVVRERRAAGRKTRGPAFLALRVVAGLSRPFLDRAVADEPFAVQFRRRLEMLGPTFIKLGQILSLREDLLPPSVTRELFNLQDRLPAIRFERFRELIGGELERPVEEVFPWIDPEPLGSASIAQIHRARTVDDEDVILKLVKPGVRETLERDFILLRVLGWTLQRFLARYQPQRIVREFCDYTYKEIDLRREADNAETFTANFEDEPDIVFPHIYRQYSTSRLLCMEFFDGPKPSRDLVGTVAEEERQRIVDLGAAAIIRMLYRDGFFHADLHPGNLVLLKGNRVGFIDLGMVGRFNTELRRTLLYYYYCLANGDSENAARFLTSVADAEAGSDPEGFRKEVEEVSRRWARSSTFEDFSIGRMILESVTKAGHFRMYLPVEMVLMVKALITYEAVGQMLLPGLNVVEATKPQIGRIFLGQFSPLKLAQEGLRGAPDLVDAFLKAPALITEGLRYLEKTTRTPPENPLAGMRGTVLAGFALLSGAVLFSFGSPWPLWVGFFLLALVLALRRGH